MKYTLPPALMDLSTNRLLLLSMLAIVVVAAWFASIYAIDEVWALKGFSPIAWVYQIWYPANFTLDFASGAENYQLSAFMHTYKAAYSLGVAPETFVRVAMAFEIILLSYAFYALCRTLLPDAPLVVPVMVIIYALASSARDLSLANFAEPYLTGQYYNVANALRILGIVMVLRRKPLLAAALLAGSFATHATLGLMGVAFAFAMQLVRPREIFSRQYIGGIVLFVVLAGGWVVTQFGQVSVAGGEIPQQVWIEMTRAFNYHWYPVDNEILTAKARLFFLPFLSFLLLLALYWPRGEQRSDMSRMASAGVLLMLALTVAGLAISVWLPIPFLIKLALHRANDLAIVIGLVYIVAGLWRDLTGSSWWRRPLAAAIFLSPWFVRPYPLLLTFALIAPTCWQVIRGHSAATADRVVLGLAISVAVICGYYLTTDIWVGLHPLAFFSERQYFWAFAVAVLAGMVLVHFLGRQSAQALVLVAALVLAVHGLQAKAKTRDVGRGQAYLEAQEWARHNTSDDALFMTDPTIYYGWRDFSRRSSFGNMREWLHTSWLYNSNFDRYTEGLRRFGEFGIELQPYLNLQPPISAVGRITNEIRQRYYTASDEWRLDLAQRYDIDYFVLQRANIIEPPGLLVVFENDYFVIYAAQR